MTASRFGELLARSDDVYAAIKEVMTRSRDDDEAVDAVEVVRELIAHYPDMTLSPAAVLQEVIRAAAEAGVPLKVTMPDPGA